MTTTLARRGGELALVEPPPPGLHALQLYEEARKASRDHLRRLAIAIEEVRALAEAVLDGGELDAPGVRDLAGRLAEELHWRGQSLAKLTQPELPARAAAGVGREVG